LAPSHALLRTTEPLVVQVCAGEDGVQRAELETPTKSRFSCLLPSTVPARAARPPPRASAVLLSPLETCAFVQPLVPTVAFFYASSVNDRTLVQAIRRTINVFPLISGRLRPARRPNAVNADYEVLCCDAGVALDVYSCSGRVADFDELQRARIKGLHTQPKSNFTPAEFNAALDMSGIMRGKAPLVHVRLTKLSDGGSILGVSCAHMIMDGVSGIVFVGRLCAEYECLSEGRSSDSIKMPSPRFDRKAFIDASKPPPDLPAEVIANGKEMKARVAGMVSAMSTGAMLSRGVKLVRHLSQRNETFTIKITGKEMRLARAAGQLATGLPLSANDVIIGVAWTLLRRLRTRGGESAPRLGDAHTMFQTIDLRRLLPGLDSFFGSVAYTIMLRAAETAKTPFEFAAASRASLNVFNESSAVFDELGVLLGGGQVSPAAKKVMLLPAFADGMFSAWHVPAMWQFRMGGQAPTSYNGGIWPLVPWGFCSAASRPDRLHLLPLVPPPFSLPPPPSSSTY
jgi:hypothetical protein